MIHALQTNASAVRTRFALLLAGLSVFTGVAAAADRALDLDMQTHARFFSAETQQQQQLDPQVFVRDAGAVAGTGPQNIQHDAGYRPALIAQSPSEALFNAQGNALGLSLGQWLGARGKVHVAADGLAVTVRLSGLHPQGVYSLFENHFDQQPIGFTPLDGSGTANTFSAKQDGKATVTIKVPARLTHANAVLLVYHSDGKAHGVSRGEIGVNAHHQLIARMP